MTINLSNYRSIGCALLCKIDVEYYKSSPSATPTATSLLFSDYQQPITYNGDTYLGLGNLVGISPTSSELKTSSGSVTITISGIPNTSIAEIVNSRIKGSPIEIYRYVFNAQTQEYLNIFGNPAGRFFGIVNNYSLDEQYDVESRTASNTITMVCSSLVEVLDNKIAGRKTNPASHKSFFGGDKSMDRVPSLVGANFNFGAPQ
jgi:hypothetical protein